MGAPKGVGSPQHGYEVAQRQKKALSLVLAGATRVEAAHALGVSESTIRKDIDRALADIPKWQANDFRKLEMKRLDRLQRAVWPRALEGDLPAFDRVLRVMERRAKMLGLDMPQKVEVAAVDVDLDSTVDKLLKVAELAGAADEGDLAGLGKMLDGEIEGNVDGEG